MFTGIVEAIGTIQRIIAHPDSVDFIITIPEFFHDIAIGDSIAINGVCLTITHISSSTLQVTAVRETLRLTNLGLLQAESKVNLERSLTLQTRLGGHIVQGHVDGTGKIISWKPDGARAITMTVSTPESLLKYIIQKGYIAVDGMSLTLIDVTDQDFSVTMIPHTQEVTIASHYAVNTIVNLEVDMVGKYIEKLLRGVKT